jgi:release factor glutamine methyltransferase
MLDLGTGSGAIALAIASSQPNVSVVATDASQAALDIAQQNAAHLKLSDRVSFCLGHWYSALQTSGNTHHRFDLILSNPPYIAANDPHLSQGDLRFEPPSALTDFGSGLTCLTAIIDGALAHLKPGGLLAVEHGFDQSPAVLERLALAGFQDITPHRDLAGHWRVASGRKPN